MNDDATNYGIRINIKTPTLGRSGFLGMADDSHVVTSAHDARRFASIADANREITRLCGTRGHYLRESRHYTAFTVIVPNPRVMA